MSTTRHQNLNTMRRLAAVREIRRRMLDQLRDLPHVDRDEEHERAVARACAQLDHMVAGVMGGQPPYVRAYV